MKPGRKRSHIVLLMKEPRDISAVRNAIPAIGTVLAVPAWRYPQASMREFPLAPRAERDGLDRTRLDGGQWNVIENG